jgi:hypothetical protein
MKRTQELKIVFGSVELIETDVSFDRDARTGVTKVRVTA